MLRTIYAGNKVYSDALNKRVLDRQVKDLAWLVVKHDFGDPSIELRGKNSVTRGGRMLRRIRLSGVMTITAKDMVDFDIDNSHGLYRMYARVFRDGKHLFTAQGDVSHCFEVMTTVITKRR